MSAEDNQVLVHRFFEELWNARHLSLADELFSADHTYHDPSIPWAGPGPEGMKQVVSTYHQAFPDARMNIDDQFVAEDRVVTRWTAQGTHTADLQGIAPTGKQIHVEGIWIHRLASGKIVESWDVWDTVGMLQQLGVVPRMGERVLFTRTLSPT
jgi:steroid delta-isomerase-like uncharacterized protein